LRAADRLYALLMRFTHLFAFVGLALSQPCIALAQGAEPDGTEKERPIGLWMGEDVGFRYSPTGDHPLGVLAGIEGGWMPLDVPLSADYHFLLGPGVRAAWGPMWHLSAVLRLSLAGSREMSPRYYVQGGPLLMRHVAGADLQAGVDWLYGGGYLGAILEPQGDGRHAWTFVIGGRVALVTIVATALLVDSILDVLGELLQ
jgi:hypothetical protein